MAQVLTNIHGTEYVDTRLRTDGRVALCVDMASDIQIGAVELKDADSDNRANLVLRDDGKWALCVDLSSDVQIGAVEIKDWNSDRRLDVIECGSYNAILTKDCSDYQKTKIIQYGETSITYNSDNVIVSYTVPTNRKFILNGVIVGGNADGEFSVLIDSSKIGYIRNSAAKRTINSSFWENTEVSAGSVIQIKGKNISHIKQNTRQFEATISGYTIPA